LILRQGGRLATPGEFTKRAVLNGRIDLNQAEAVHDIVTARTERQLEYGVAQLRGELSSRLGDLKDDLMELLASVECEIDFAEDEPVPENRSEQVSRIKDKIEALVAAGEEGRLLSQGVMVAIVGRPNVGKSSLLNALAAEERAIVTSIPGTTRDTLREWLNLRGYPFELVDTAGLRKTRGLIEVEGQRKTEASISDADVVLVVLDGSIPLTPEDMGIIRKVGKKAIILVVNKIDLVDEGGLLSLRAQLNGHPLVEISATERIGLENLQQKLLELARNGVGSREERFAVRSAWQRSAVLRCADAYKRAVTALTESMPVEIVALELKDAIAALDVTCGSETTEEVLNRIFSRFCIGK
jgi:tRNA modification GTPase